MKITSNQFIRACSLSIALIGSTAVIATFAMPDYAYAKNGNGGGNGKGGGKGNGGGNGGGGGHGNGSGHGGGNGNGGGADKSENGKTGGNSKRSGSKAQKSGGKGVSLKDLFGGQKVRKAVKPAKPAKSAKPTTAKRTRAAPQQVKTRVSARPPTKPNGNKVARALGVHPSELGALNAANANKNAFENAAPSSRVGRLGAYKDAVLKGNALGQELAARQAMFDNLTTPDRPLNEIEADLDQAVRDAQEKADRVLDLETALAGAGGIDPEIEEELAKARSDLETSLQAEDVLSAEQQAAVEYDSAAAAVAALAQAVDAQVAVERAILEEAANKPVTDEVEAAVKTILGL